jgi:heme-degrading monooxygenase HmoA
MLSAVGFETPTQSRFNPDDSQTLIQQTTPMSPPKPPYYAVIFSSKRTADDNDLYAERSEAISCLAAIQPGYLGFESARDSTRHGITVSYWDSLENIKKWKINMEHLVVQKMGKELFYEEYHVRVAKVEREYHWTSSVSHKVTPDSTEPTDHGMTSPASENL